MRPLGFLAASNDEMERHGKIPRQRCHVSVVRWNMTATSPGWLSPFIIFGLSTDPTHYSCPIFVFWLLDYDPFCSAHYSLMPSPFCLIATKYNYRNNAINQMFFRNQSNNQIHIPYHQNIPSQMHIRTKESPICLHYHQHSRGHITLVNKISQQNVCIQQSFQKNLECPECQPPEVHQSTKVSYQNATSSKYTTTSLYLNLSAGSWKA
jgi:hypothetical protein